MQQDGDVIKTKTGQLVAMVGLVAMVAIVYVLREARALSSMSFLILG